MADPLADLPPTHAPGLKPDEGGGDVIRDDLVVGVSQVHKGPHLRAGGQAGQGQQVRCSGHFCKGDLAGVL